MLSTEDKTDSLSIWTVGHSNRSALAFIELLHAHGIEALADIRRFPGSRKHPHFAGEALARSLSSAGIAYHGLPELGGRRRPRPDSGNTRWRSAAFRGYADFMESAEFAAAIETLLHIARAKRTAIMCAEALWWRCHRALVADYLKARGAQVWHIAGTGKATAHPYTSAARVVDGELNYGR